MTTLANPANDLSKIQADLQAAYQSRPDFGSITITAHFVAGRLARIERGRNESMKAFSGGER